MPRSNFLRVVLLGSLIVIIAFPLYAYFYQRPLFWRLQKENVTKEAYRTASYLSVLLNKETDSLTIKSISDSFRDEIREVEKDGHVMKINVYGTSGEVLYSTDPSEIGTVNTEEYFVNLVRASSPIAKEITKGMSSLENEVVAADLIETYVPIIRSGRIAGVFEVYHDISEENEKLSALLNRTNGLIFLLAFVLLVSVTASIYRADQYLAKRAEAEREKQNLIGELQAALQQVRKLSGFLPICASCKKIRDDKGYWNQIESYIREHSEAEFSHGLCPDCAKSLYPDIYKDNN